MLSFGLSDFHKSTRAAAQSALLARWDRGNEDVVTYQHAGMVLGTSVVNAGAHSDVFEQSKTENIVSRRLCTNIEA